MFDVKAAKWTLLRMLLLLLLLERLRQSHHRFSASSIGYHVTELLLPTGHWFASAETPLLKFEHVSVDLLVTTVSSANTAEPIEMPFERVLMEPKEPCIRWRSRYPQKRGFFGGRASGPLKTMGIFC